MTDADIIIVGGGASGLASALYAAKNSAPSMNIYVLEHKDSVGRKLLATGNGRCNFTNDVLDDESYRGNNATVAYSLVGQFDRECLLKWFEDLGVMHTCINGYYYPRSLQASQILDSICTALNELGVRLVCGTNVTDIMRDDGKYVLKTDNGTYRASYVVLAAGGKAYKSLGSDGSGYTLARRLGHSITPLVPSLIGLKAEGIDFRMCQGVRAKGLVTIYADGRELSSSYGEIQFADYGVSGIPVFQVSRYAGMALLDGKNVEAAVDLLNEYSIDEAVTLIQNILHNNPGKTMLGIINAFVPIKLAKTVLRKLNIPDDASGVSWLVPMAESVVAYMKDIHITITGNCGYDKAQVTAGGIYTDEVDSATLESRYAPNVYIVGELLDIDGNCGGYNLHFAFASGAAAGISIGKKVNG